jgi:hypothetical protein
VAEDHSVCFYDVTRTTVRAPEEARAERKTTAGANGPSLRQINFVNTDHILVYPVKNLSGITEVSKLLVAGLTFPIHFSYPYLGPSF